MVTPDEDRTKEFPLSRRKFIKEKKGEMCTYKGEMSVYHSRAEKPYVLPKERIDQSVDRVKAMYPGFNE